MTDRCITSGSVHSAGPLSVVALHHYYYPIRSVCDKVMEKFMAGRVYISSCRKATNKLKHDYTASAIKCMRLLRIHCRLVK